MKPFIELKKSSLDQHDFWLLINFSDIFIRSNEDKERCLIFVNTSSPDFYNIDYWNPERLVSFYVPEENLIELNLGNIYNYLGEHISSTSTALRKHLKIHNVQINYKGDKYNSNINDLFFKDTILSKCFPNMFFHIAPNSNGQFYIPTALILKYFFYHSSNLISYILNYFKADEGFKRIGDTDIYLYDPHIIHSKDIIHIIKYLYTNNYEDVTGFDILKKMVSHLYNTISKIKRDFQKTKIKAELIAKFPFNRFLNAKVLAQEIIPGKYLVYSIEGIDCRKHSLFKKNDIILINIRDSRQVDEYLSDQTKDYIGKMIKLNDSFINSENYNYHHTDSNSNIEAIEKPITTNFFNNTPEYKILDKKASKHKYILKKINDYIITDHAITNDNKNNISEIRGINPIMSTKQKESTPLYEEIFTSLKTQEQIESIRYTQLIKNEKPEYYNDFKTKIINNNKFIIIKFRISIPKDDNPDETKNYDFYLVHKTSGKRIGLIYLDHKVEGNDNIEVQLKNFLSNLKNNYNFSKYFLNPNKYSNFRDETCKKILKKYGLIVLKSINISSNNPEDIVKNLMTYLKSFIQ